MTPADSNTPEGGAEDAAILLMSLGEENAAAVFKHLSPKEVQKVGEAIARMHAVRASASASSSGSAPREPEHPRRRQRRIRAQRAAQGARRREGRAAARPHHAERRRERHREPEVDGPERRRRAAAQTSTRRSPRRSSSTSTSTRPGRAQMLRRAAAQRSAAARVATLDGIQPSALKDLNDVMSRHRRRRAAASPSLGGVKTAAEIINLLGASVETSVLDFCATPTASSAQRIMDNMFSFDDCLVKIDDKGIQALLKEIQTESLVIALRARRRAARQDLQHVDPRRRTLREDPSRGPVPRVGRGRAEGTAQGRAPARRRGPDEAIGGEAATMEFPEGAVGPLAAQRAAAGGMSKACRGLRPLHPARVAGSLVRHRSQALTGGARCAANAALQCTTDHRAACPRRRRRRPNC